MSQPGLLYTLRPGVDVREEVVRISGEIAARGRALVSESKAPTGQSVHEGRLLIKRLRALMWFARPALPLKDYRQTQVRLRKAAGLLAGSRDLNAARATLEKLKDKVSGKRDVEALDRVTRRELGSPLSRRGEAAISPRIFRKAMGLVRAGIAEFTRLVKRGDKWPAPRKRVEKASRAARNAGRKAWLTKGDVEFHTWRKKAKRLLYQLELTQPEPTPHLAHVIARVEKLQSALGDYHDRVVTEERLRKIRPLHASARRVLRLLAESKKRVGKQARKISREIGAT